MGTNKVDFRTSAHDAPWSASCCCAERAHCEAACVRRPAASLDASVHQWNGGRRPPRHRSCAEARRLRRSCAGRGGDSVPTVSSSRTGQDTRSSRTADAGGPRTQPGGGATCCDVELGSVSTRDTAVTITI